MKVRIARQEDIPALLKIYRYLHPDDEETTLDDAHKNWELILRYPGSNIFVGAEGKEIVATCTLIVIPNLTRGGASYALIENVVTDPAHRNKGYGRAVLQVAVEAAWRGECYKVMLLTGSRQPSTLKFYQDAGFEQNKTGFQMRRIPPRVS